MHTFCLQQTFGINNINFLPKLKKKIRIYLRKIKINCSVDVVIIKDCLTAIFALFLSWNSIQKKKRKRQITQRIHRRTSCLTYIPSDFVGAVVALTHMSMTFHPSDFVGAVVALTHMSMTFHSSDFVGAVVVMIIW
jgi:hypothetical protein